jgi:carbon storage regulator
MLVLTRNPGERILIGNTIVIEILGTQADGSVRVGITAPHDFLIDREEVRSRLGNQPRHDGRVQKKKFK